MTQRILLSILVCSFSATTAFGQSEAKDSAERRYFIGSSGSSWQTPFPMTIHPHYFS
jgi:hypothetical protein